jgi:hypothetical protein
MRRAEGSREALFGAGIGHIRRQGKALQIEAERARLLANIQNIVIAQKCVHGPGACPASGTFVAEVSSIDAQFAREELAKKDASQLLALSRQARDARSEKVKDGRAVNAGDPLGKVQTGQNVVFYLP